MKARTEAEPEETNYGSFNLLGTFIAELHCAIEEICFSPPFMGALMGASTIGGILGKSGTDLILSSRLRADLGCPLNSLFCVC